MIVRTILLLAVVHAGCGRRDPSACLARCERRFGAGEVCSTLCSRDCAELHETFGVSEATCLALQSGEPEVAATSPEPRPEPSPAEDSRSRCGEFVAFAYGCGIGRPAPDPTVDLATQRNNELVIQQGVVAQCERGQPPYDEHLIGCFQAAAPDCARYRVCADAVVKARAPGSP